MSNQLYNDLLFEIYHYIPREPLMLSNKICCRLQMITKERIHRYVYRINYRNTKHNPIESAFINNDMLYIRELIKKKQIDFDIGLKGASNQQNIHMIKTMIKYGATCFNYVLTASCIKGNMKLVKYSIKKNADDWRNGLLNACIGNNKRIIKLMMIKLNHHHISGFMGACMSGSVNLVKFIMRKDNNYYLDDLDGGLYIACNLNNKKLNDKNFFKNVIHTNYTNIIKLLIKKGAMSCENCHKSMSEHLLKK